MDGATAVSEGSQQSHPTACPDATGLDVLELAHQVQNRLAVVRACLQLAMARCGCAQARPHLGRALTSVEDAALWVALLIRGRLTDPLHQRERLALEQVAMEVADEFGPLFERGEIALQMEVACHEPLWVMGWRPLLKAALAHVLANAAEAAPRGSVVRMRVYAHRGDGGEPPSAWICVEDGGPGLPEDVLSQLFQRPISTKEPGGRGLGLLSAYRTITVLHGGWMRVSNLPGGGARVCLGLPLQPAPEPSSR